MEVWHFLTLLLSKFRLLFSFFSWNIICVLLLYRFGMQVENAISSNNVSEIEECPQVRSSSRKTISLKQIVEMHYTDIAWTPLRSIPPTTQQFSKQLREANMGLNPYYVPLLGESTGDHTGKQCGKGYHDMTSSWTPNSLRSKAVTIFIMPCNTGDKNPKTRLLTLVTTFY